MEQATNPSTRLTTIAGAVVPGLAAADVGMDHALLSFNLLQNGIVPFVVGIELSNGPYQRAKKAVSSSSWEKHIILRQGDGLEPLAPGEVGNVIIAGMGGDNIAEILSRDWKKAESFAHYVLQPMSRFQVVRETLAGRGWPIINEYLLREKGHFFVVIISRPGSQPYRLSPMEAELGPVILKARGEIVLSYLESTLQKYIRIVRAYRRAGFPDTDPRCDDMRRKIEELEEIICKLR